MTEAYFHKEAVSGDLNLTEGLIDNAFDEISFEPLLGFGGTLSNSFNHVDFSAPEKEFTSEHEQAKAYAHRMDLQTL